MKAAHDSPSSVHSGAVSVAAALSLNELLLVSLLRGLTEVKNLLVCSWRVAAAVWWCIVGCWWRLIILCVWLCVCCGFVFVVVLCL